MSKVIIHQSLFLPYFSAQLRALYGSFPTILCSTPQTLRFIPHIPLRISASSAVYSPIFLCAALYPLRFIPPYFSAQFRTLCGLYLIHDFLTAEDAKERRVSKVIIHHLYLCYVSLRSSVPSTVHSPQFSAVLPKLCGSSLIFLCVSLRPLRFIPPYFSAQFRALCGLFPTILCSTPQTLRFIPHIPLRISASTTVYSPIFLCAVPYPLRFIPYSWFLTAESAECSRELFTSQR